MSINANMNGSEFDFDRQHSNFLLDLHMYNLLAKVWNVASYVRRTVNQIHPNTRSRSEQICGRNIKLTASNTRRMDGHSFGSH